MILILCALTQWMSWQWKETPKDFSAKWGGCVLSHLFAGDGSKTDKSGSGEIKYGTWGIGSRRFWLPCPPPPPLSYPPPFSLSSLFPPHLSSTLLLSLESSTSHIVYSLPPCHASFFSHSVQTPYLHNSCLAFPSTLYRCWSCFPVLITSTLRSTNSVSFSFPTW